MIRATFRYADGEIKGFSLLGHAGGMEGTDIVCAAVSSAAYMTANTLTDVCGLTADIDLADGKLSLLLAENTASAKTVLEGFLLHLQELQKQYPTRIQVLKTEV